MLIANKIDQLIENLNNLRPELTESKFANRQKFNDLMQSSFQIEEQVSNPSNETKEILSQQKNEISFLPDIAPHNSNVKTDVSKPNMKELMEKLSGRKIEDLYADPDSDWVNLSIQASEILYGVLGSRADTRNWSQIMASKHIMDEARLETGKMFQPKVEIETLYDNSENIESQSAVIKDKSGVILRQLSNNLYQTEFALLNYGADKSSIPTNLKEKIMVDDFDQNLIEFLTSYKGSPARFANNALRTATDVLSAQIELSVKSDMLEEPKMSET